MGRKFPSHLQLLTHRRVGAFQEKDDGELKGKRKQTNSLRAANGARQEKALAGCRVMCTQIKQEKKKGSQHMAGNPVFTPNDARDGKEFYLRSGGLKGGGVSNRLPFVCDKRKLMHTFQL